MFQFFFLKKKRRDR